MASKTNCVLANQMEEMVGSTVYSAIGANGTGYDAPGFVAGKFGKALSQANATTDSVDFADSASYRGTKGCARLWIKPVGWSLTNGDPNDAKQHYTWNCAEANEIFTIGFVDNGFWWRLIAGGAGQGGYNAATAIPEMDAASGAQNHLACTWNSAGIGGGSDTQRIYWNGTQVSSSTTAISAMPGAQGGWNLGIYEWDHSVTQQWKGELENLQVFDNDETDHSDYLTEWFTGTHLYPFTRSGRYTHDSDLIEFSAGKAQLKEYAPASKAFYASYDVDEDADFSLGATAGTLTAGAVITAAQQKFGAKSLYPDGSQVDSGVYYAGTNVDAGDRTFTWQIWYRPEYSGAPTSDSGVPWMAYEHSVGDNDSRVQWRHTSAGLLQVLRRDAGNNVKNYTGGSWSPTAGSWYQLVYENDTRTPGASRFYVDGVQIGTTDTQVVTRNARDTYYVGRWKSGGVAPGANKHGWIDDVLVSQDILYAGNFTPVEAPVGYSKDDPSIISNDSSFNAGAYTSFAATTGGTGSVQFIIEVGGQDKYWTGAAWASSDGTWAQSNTAATINTNIGTLAGGTTKVKALLRSDGSQQPTLDLIEMGYSAPVADGHQQTMQRGYW